MTTQEAITEASIVAEHLRDHAETDPNPANLRKVAKWAACEIKKLTAPNAVAIAG